MANLMAALSSPLPDEVMAYIATIMILSLCAHIAVFIIFLSEIVRLFSRETSRIYTVLFHKKDATADHRYCEPVCCSGVLSVQQTQNGRHDVAHSVPQGVSDDESVSFEDLSEDESESVVPSVGQ